MSGLFRSVTMFAKNLPVKKENNETGHLNQRGIDENTGCLEVARQFVNRIRGTAKVSPVTPFATQETAKPEAKDEIFRRNLRDLLIRHLAKKNKNAPDALNKLSEQVKNLFISSMSDFPENSNRRDYILGYEERDIHQVVNGAPVVRALNSKDKISVYQHFIIYDFSLLNIQITAEQLVDYSFNGISFYGCSSEKMKKVINRILDHLEEVKKLSVEINDNEGAEKYRKIIKNVTESYQTGIKMNKEYHLV